MCIRDSLRRPRRYFRCQRFVRGFEQQHDRNKRKRGLEFQHFHEQFRIKLCRRFLFADGRRIQQRNQRHISFGIQRIHYRDIRKLGNLAERHPKQWMERERIPVRWTDGRDLRYGRKLCRNQYWTSGVQQRLPRYGRDVYKRQEYEQ